MSIEMEELEEGVYISTRSTADRLRDLPPPSPEEQISFTPGQLETLARASQGANASTGWTAKIRDVRPLAGLVAIVVLVSWAIDASPESAVANALAAVAGGVVGAVGGPLAHRWRKRQNKTTS